MRPERIAEDLIQSHRVATAPVDVTALARELDLRVIKEALPEDVSGVLLTRTGSPPTIVVNRAHHRHRQRFTVAHELGHFILGHHDQSQTGVHVDRGFRLVLRGPLAAAGVDAREIAANRFAAALLMPEALVRHEVAAQGSRPIDDQAVEHLARTFAVSEQAMHIRLTALRLL
jgi:Zn-dependent peptidase ImmA (M78 family)